jgi:putative endopeptidase
VKRFFILCVIALIAVAQPALAKTILFVGNSFTYGELSPVKTYKANTVTDLNRSGIGGVPALFKAFATQAGLDYDVSLETAPGVGLDYHYAEKHSLLDRKWDEVILQSFSTLDQNRAGDPALLVKYTGIFSDMLRGRNPDVKIYLTATWSRADMTYPPRTPWYGMPISQMAKDVDAGYRLAAQKTPEIAAVIPVGLAWNRAMDDGIADGNPYDGIAAGKIDLWARDHYHASTYGYYLEALLIFGRVTGRDPLSVGVRESSIRELSLDPEIVRKLEQIAHDELVKH